MSQSRQAIEELTKAIEEAELDEEFIVWVRDQTQPEKLLVSSMINEFIANMDSDQTYAHSILKALK